MPVEGPPPALQWPLRGGSYQEIAGDANANSASSVRNE
jgi:hypothetical protein